MTGFLKMTKLDFITMKSQIIGYATLILVVIMYSLMGTTATILCITGAWFVALMSFNIFAVQEKNHLDQLYGSISIRFNDIVLGRYIFILLTYFTSLLVVIAIHVTFALFQNKSIILLDIIRGLSVSFLVFSTITGVQMPIFFKLGYTKARIWSMLPFTIVIILVAASSFVPTLTAIVGRMQESQVVLIIGCILVSCVIEFLSYKVAVFAYRRRE